jgi:DNA-binding XRE family transcriptional regulator
MAKSYEELLSNVSPTVRAKATVKAARYSRQIEKQRIKAALKSIRKASGLGQKQLAEALGIKQPTVARMENQGDIKLSTLMDIVRASGGVMEINVKMQGRKVQFHS